MRSCGRGLSLSTAFQPEPRDADCIRRTVPVPNDELELNTKRVPMIPNISPKKAGMKLAAGMVPPSPAWAKDSANACSLGVCWVVGGVPGVCGAWGPVGGTHGSGGQLGWLERFPNQVVCWTSCAKAGDPH